MDCVLFDEWIRELDCKFASSRRHNASLVDSCPSHHRINSYKLIDLCFLPPNTSSKLQLMEQGVIRILNPKCRSNIIWEHIKSLDKTNSPTQILLLCGMQMLCLAWNVIDFCIFIVSPNVEFPQKIARGLLPMKMILRGSHTEVVPSKITTKDLVDVDDEVLTTEPFTDEEFLADFRELQVEQNNSDNKKDNNDAIDEPAKCKKKMYCWMTSTCCRRFHYLSMRGEVSCMQFAINCSVKLIRT